MVAATHGCPQATPEGSLHHVKRHDVPSVHRLASRQPIMSLRPLRIRREHFAESSVGRYGLYEPSDSPIESELRIERKLRMIGLANALTC